MDMVIYEGIHSECLIGLDILNERFNLLISSSGVYMKKEDLENHNKRGNTVSKLGTNKTLQMVVSI